MSYYRYHWEPLFNGELSVYNPLAIRKQHIGFDEKGPHYRMPFGSKFKKVFVSTCDYDNYVWNCDFVLESKTGDFKSEIYSDLIADPKNPYIVATDNGGGRQRLRIYNLKEGTTHLYYRLKHPQYHYEDRNSKESSIAVDLENNHIVEIDTNFNVTETGLSIVLDEENKWEQLSCWPHIVLKNEKDKYLVYKVGSFKPLTDKEFDVPCEIAEKFEKNKVVAVGIKDDKAKYIYDPAGNLMATKSLEEAEKADKD